MSPFVRTNPVFLAVALATLALAGCGDGGEQPQLGVSEPYVSEVDEVPGVAVAILVDTSGSMGATAMGDPSPKHRVARAALQAALDLTDAFRAKRPELPVKVALLRFSDEVEVLLPMQPYDRGKVQAALAGIPSPGGETAIGLALDAARRELYRSGCFRKYVLVVTDGENTRGVEPEAMAREIHRRSELSVSMFFVAFDTDPAKFGFLKDVGGDVASASDAAELEEVLKTVYEGRILAEALDAE